MIGILNIGVGNVQSVYNAIYENGFDPVFVNSPDEIKDLSHLILPGVGNFSAVMANLNKLNFVNPIKNFSAENKPMLGICLGMQLLASYSEEGNKTSGLNIIPATVSKIDNTQQLRVPHVGWNEVNCTQKHPIFINIKDQRDFYFVHSYHMQCNNRENVIATTHYGTELTCAVAYKNVVGVQFHPEKSQKNGMQLLENFCNWDGQC
ncbi:MAG: imidazole glycerol phosphate synthase subunit HisH [Colwellia sp.]|nr:imidazole glycerol phosphate synthase subunit HisH [Colwellia sp.]NQZ80646.1 imidazole glycerol phosphate synthase subunit HisH [Colwellia sp.]